MSDNVTLTVPKEQVQFVDKMAVVDIGMDKFELARAILEYIASEQDTMAVLKTKHKKEAQE